MSFLTTILRRSVSLSRSSISAVRLVGAASHFNCNCSSCASKKPNLFRNLMTPSSSPSSFRQFSDSTLSVHDESLLEVIEQEITCADEPEVQEAPEDFPFKIEDKPGRQTVSLSADFDGETINIEVYMPNVTVEEDSVDTNNENDNDNNNDNDNDNDNHDQDEDENPDECSMSLVVRLNKKSGLVLEFGCTAFPDQILIDSLAVKDPDNVEDPLAYEGPDFSDLDEDLQKAFYEYLEIRGIKPSTTNFLYEYMVNKDSKEYLVWLKNLKEYVQA